MDEHEINDVSFGRKILPLTVAAGRHLLVTYRRKASYPT